VHDGFGAHRRGLDPVARGKITDHELDLLSAFAAAAAEYSDVVAGVAQPRDNEPPQRARATGDQNG
jgi:hypothetical protein